MKFIHIELAKKKQRTFCQAVPLFLQRMKNLGILKDVLHQANLTSLDVAAVLRESVSAAESILDCATSRPLCDEEHYPLPRNVTGRWLICLFRLFSLKT